MIKHNLFHNTMNRKIILTGILAIVLLSGCSEEQQATQEEELVKTVNVEAHTIEPRPFVRHLKLIGTIEAQNDVRISAEVTGRILEYFVEQGDMVEKGEPILKIDDSQLIHERQRLEAATALSRENYERLKRLYEQESIGSEIDYLNAKYTYEQNKASLKLVEENIAKTRVTAPFDATIEEIVLEEGEMANPGVELVRLIGTNQLKVSVGVPAHYSDVVQKGDMAKIWFDFQKADTLRLPITFVGKSINSQDRTFEVEIELPARAREHKVDMITNVMIQTLQEEKAIVVGKEFIFQAEGQDVIYTVDENEKGEKVARLKPVTLGASYENEVVVTSGLNAGEQLITVGASFLQDNMRINIVNEKEDEFAQKIF